MSSLYDMSLVFSTNMSQQIRGMANKKKRRVLEAQLTACPLIRCELGGLFHMESEAKLTMLHHVINGVVFLMVNFKKY